jgi:hypothetical protein
VTPVRSRSLALKNNYNKLPKKKKRKTRKEKQLKEKRRDIYIENVDNTQSIASESDGKADIKTKRDVKSKTALSENDIKSQNDKFIVSNIKRALVYAFVFLLIIAALYISELKYHYFNDWASGLMDVFI